MRTFRILAVILLAVVVFNGVANATPSTTFWTPMVMDIQPYGVFHLGVDNYFRVFTKASPSGSLPTDLTIPEIGVLPFDKVQMEVGIDYMANTDYPWLFNGKIGSLEDSYFKGQPAIEIAVFDVGTKSSGPSRTDWDVAYMVIGKTIDPIGRFSIGPYIGNHAALISSNGEHNNTGVMVAFDHGFFPVMDKDGNVDYNKVVFAADYASGKNVIGGGGFGVYYYFTKDISLLTGPVWFNDTGINGQWKWTVQLDINLPKLFGKK